MTCGFNKKNTFNTFKCFLSTAKIDMLEKEAPNYIINQLVSFSNDL